jgi:hypothetical protein
MYSRAGGGKHADTMIPARRHGCLPVRGRRQTGIHADAGDAQNIRALTRARAAANRHLTKQASAYLQ